MDAPPTGTDVVEHEVRVAARPETVFGYFTDPQRMVEWMGTAATLDPRPGGVCRIEITGASTMLGEFTAVEPYRRIALTWGWEQEWLEVPPQSTEVEVTFTPDRDGTIVHLVHRRLPDGVAAFHRAGWQQHLGRLTAAAGELPVLWQLKVSHYNEKARWALDHKRVPHARRAVMPGRHQALAGKLTGGRTLPILVLDGEAIGDSTDIIAALERRHPDRALYPAGADDRRRALELEDYFDEELGPYTRLLCLHLALPDAALVLGTFAPDLTGARRTVARATFPRLRPRLAKQFGIDDESVALAYDKVRAAGERYAAEAGSSGYLVGHEFTVADLTLAALLAPLVAPAQFPYPQPQRDHPLLEPAREAVAEAGLLDWTREMYARHRGRSAEVAA